MNIFKFQIPNSAIYEALVRNEKMLKAASPSFSDTDSNTDEKKTMLPTSSIIIDELRNSNQILKEANADLIAIIRAQYLSGVIGQRTTNMFAGLNIVLVIVAVLVTVWPKESEKEMLNEAQRQSRISQSSLNEIKLLRSSLENFNKTIVRQNDSITLARLSKAQKIK